MAAAATPPRPPRADRRGAPCPGRIHRRADARADPCVPTRAGIDTYSPVFSVLRTWLRARAIPFKVLGGKRAVRSATGASRDQVHLAHLSSSTRPSTRLHSATRSIGRVHLRPERSRRVGCTGAAARTAKTAVAMFCHLPSSSRPANRERPSGFRVRRRRAHGRFQGMRSCLDDWGRGSRGRHRLSGNERLFVGSRGLWRRASCCAGLRPTRAARSRGARTRSSSLAADRAPRGAAARGPTAGTSRSSPKSR